MTRTVRLQARQPKPAGTSYQQVPGLKHCKQPRLRRIHIRIWSLRYSYVFEPLTKGSLKSYLFYQLRCFNEWLDESIIAYKAGLVPAAFSAAQCATAMVCGLTEAMGILSLTGTWTILARGASLWPKDCI